MPRTKISEFSATPGNNTDIDGINLAEGCAPSGINDAIRELMAQLKDFQAGTAGDSFNGPIGSTTPAAGTFTNLSASGTFALTGDQVQISEGGTGQTTANAAFNALAPSQTSNAGKYLKTDGTNTSWDALDISTADITGTLPIANGGTGLTALGTGVQTALGQNVTGSGGIVLASSPSLTTPNLGTPSAVTLTNATGLPLSTGVTGTLATTNGGTGLTSFTANGVVYASSSSALTTGSALTFDGTNLSVTSPSTSTTFTLADNGGRLVVLQNSLGAGGVAQVGTTTNHDFYVRAGAGPAGLNSLYLQAGGVTGYALSYAGASTWYVGGTRSMDLTSTGLKVGTTSDFSGAKVVTDGGGIGILNKGLLRSSTNGVLQVSADPNNAYASSQISFDVDGSTVATLDSSGNLGLGMAPSAWNTAFAPVLQIKTPGGGAGAFAGSGVDNFRMFANTYYDGSYKRIGAGYATQYEQASGYHAWYTAGSSTANSAISFTQAMTLDASGNLGVGTTSPSTRIHAVATGGAIRMQDSAGTAKYVQMRSDSTNSHLEHIGGPGDALRINNQAAGTIEFFTSNTERARITSGGDLLVGTTSADGKTTINTSSNQRNIQFNATDSSTYTEAMVYVNGFRNTTNGTWKYLSCAINGVGEKLQIIDSGTVNNATGTYGTISDARLKQDIVDAGSQWDDLKAIRFRKYRMKTDVEANPDAPALLGVVAQELEQVCPGLVDESNNEDGSTTKTVKSSILLMKAAVALQEAMARIEQLEAKVAALEAK